VVLLVYPHVLITIRLPSPLRTVKRRRGTLQFGSFRHFEADSKYTYEDLYTETTSSGTVRAKLKIIPHQNSPDSTVKHLTSCMESPYSKTDGLWTPQWPQYMPPTPPIPHIYYASCPSSTHSTSGLSGGKLDFDVYHQKRRVRFSDSVNIRIIFGGISDGDRELVIDTQLVDVLRRFGRVFDFGPIRVVVVAPHHLDVVFLWHRCTTSRHRRRFNLLLSTALLTAAAEAFHFGKKLSPSLNEYRIKIDFKF